MLEGRRIWVVVPAHERPNPDNEEVSWKSASFVYDCRVLSVQKFLPAEGERKKHLVKLWTDPGGTRVLTVGSIRLKDPGRVAAALERADREREAAEAQA